MPEEVLALEDARRRIGRSWRMPKGMPKGIKESDQSAGSPLLF